MIKHVVRQLLAVCFEDFEDSPEQFLGLKFIIWDGKKQRLGMIISEEALYTIRIELHVQVSSCNP